MRRSRATQQSSNEEVPASIDGIPRFKVVDGMIGGSSSSRSIPDKIKKKQNTQA